MMRQQVPTWLAVVIIIAVIALVVGILFSRRQRIVITEEELKSVIGKQYNSPIQQKQSGKGEPVGSMYQSPP